MSTVLPVITTVRSHNVKVDLIETPTISLVEKIRKEKKGKILGELEPCKPNGKKRKCDKGKGLICKSGIQNEKNFTCQRGSTYIVS